MPLSDYVLYRVAKNWPSPMERMTQDLGAEPGTDAYNMAYAQFQYDRKVRVGMMRAVHGLEVLEIGTGHGGIACYMATAGAKKVVGIDLNTLHLDIANRYAEQVSARFCKGYKLPVEFLEMGAEKTTFPDQSFDLVLADNVFEHFMEPETVMRECHRILRPNGGILVPIFSSIKSKYGLHLKHALKLPWANLVFSEKTILRAVHRLAVHRPELYDLYPGLRNNPQRVRDVRRYGDLNDITYSKFRTMARRSGFDVETFKVHGTRLGMIVSRTPGLRNTILSDILSFGAAAYLRKRC